MAEQLIIRIKLHHQQLDHGQPAEIHEEDNLSNFKPLIAKIIAAIVAVVAIIFVILPDSETPPALQVTKQKSQTTMTKNQKTDATERYQDQANQSTQNLAKPVPLVALKKQSTASKPTPIREITNTLKIANTQEITKAQAKLQKSPISSPTKNLTPAEITGQFTSGIKKLKPIDNLGAQIKPIEGKFTRSIYYYTIIKNQKGKKLTHKWEQNGKQRASIASQITQNRQVMYSSKKITNNMTGEWKVSVIDEAGNILKVDSFNY